MSDEPGSSLASIEVAVPDAAWGACVADPETIVRRVTEACLRRALPEAAAGRLLEVSIVLTDDEQVRLLNGRHRGRDKATNVLSFPAIDWEGVNAGGGALESQPSNAGIPLLLGDVVVARETLLTEAVAQGKAADHHLAHLIAHGVLHLMGYDHEDEPSAARMESLEASLLQTFDIPDPYADQAATPSAESVAHETVRNAIS